MTTITTIYIIILIFIGSIIGFAAYLIIDDYISKKKWSQLICFSIGLFCLILNLFVNSWILTFLVFMSIFLWGDD